jgi:hypothetical protein
VTPAGRGLSLAPPTAPCTLARSGDDGSFVTGSTSANAVEDVPEFLVTSRRNAASAPGVATLKAQGLRAPPERLVATFVEHPCTSGRRWTP